MDKKYSTRGIITLDLADGRVVGSRGGVATALDINYYLRYTQW